MAKHGSGSDARKRRHKRSKRRHGGSKDCEDKGHGHVCRHGIYWEKEHKRKHRKRANHARRDDEREKEREKERQREKEREREKEERRRLKRKQKERRQRQRAREILDLSDSDDTNIAIDEDLFDDANKQGVKDDRGKKRGREAERNGEKRDNPREKREKPLEKREKPREKPDNPGEHHDERKGNGGKDKYKANEQVDGEVQDDNIPGHDEPIRRKTQIFNGQRFHQREYEDPGMGHMGMRYMGMGRRDMDRGYYGGRMRPGYEYIQKDEFPRSGHGRRFGAVPRDDIDRDIRGLGGRPALFL